MDILIPVKNLVPQFAIATLAVVATAVGIGTPAHAYSTYFGEDLNNSESVPLSSYPNAKNAQNQFLSNLVGVGTENFEGFSNGTKTPLSLNFTGAGTATLNGSGGVVASVTPGQTDGSGGYAISGNKYFDINAASFSIDFTQPVAALGFYGVDVGDYGGQLTLTVTNTGGSTQTLTVPNTIGQNASTGGSVLYYGFTASNPNEQISKVAFGNSFTGDIFAFDDFTVGSFQQVKAVPEPSTTFGFGIALGFGALMKRMSSRKQNQIAKSKEFINV